MTTNIKGVGNMVSENKRKNNDIYDAKAYRQMTIKLRKGDDDDIIDAFKEEIRNGGTNRATLRKWYQAYLESNK